MRAFHARDWGSNPHSSTPFYRLCHLRVYILIISVSTRPPLSRVFLTALFLPEASKNKKSHEKIPALVGIKPVVQMSRSKNKGGI